MLFGDDREVVLRMVVVDGRVCVVGGFQASRIRFMAAVRTFM